MKARRLNTIQNWPELARQANWSVTRLAALCGVSRRTLHRYFASRMGANPKVWLAQDRQTLALQLVRTGLYIKEASSEVGYKTSEPFCREFKKHHGECATQKANVPKSQ